MSRKQSPADQRQQRAHCPRLLCHDFWALCMPADMCQVGFVPHWLLALALFEKKKVKKGSTEMAARPLSHMTCGNHKAAQ